MDGQFTGIFSRRLGHIQDRVGYNPSSTSPERRLDDLLALHAAELNESPFLFFLIRRVFEANQKLGQHQVETEDERFHALAESIPQGSIRRCPLSVIPITHSLQHSPNQT